MESVDQFPQYEIHPIANIFPMMSPDEIKALAEDIQKNGQRQPIWVADDKIIDGRSRYEACKLIGCEPRVQYWSFQGSAQSLTAFVISLNLHRRHLTPSQRAAIAVEALPFFEAEAKERRDAELKQNKLLQKITAKSEKAAVEQKFAQRSDASETLVQNFAQASEKGKSAQLAASIFKSNRQYVKDAKKIKAADPALHEQVKAGTVSLQEAKRKIKPASEQVSKDTGAALYVLERFKRLWKTLTDAEKQTIREWIEKEGQ